MIVILLVCIVIWLAATVYLVEKDNRDMDKYRVDYHSEYPSDDDDSDTQDA
jgi:hypothetical protein